MTDQQPTPPTLSPSNPSPSGELYFLSLNPHSKETILFLHGGFGTHAEWSLIAPHLPNYHLLLPDLPGHGWRSSSHIRPFTLRTSISHLSSLIRTHAHNQHAHVVGFSLGAYTALFLAAEHPSLVDRIFVTGCGQTWEMGALATKAAEWFFFASARIPRGVMDVFNRQHGIVVPEDVRIEDSKTTQMKSYAYARELVGALRGFASGRGEQFGGEKVSGRVKAPTLVVAGTAHDPVGYTGQLARELREAGCKESRAVKLVGMPHG